VEPSRRRLLSGIAFALLTTGACVLLAKRLTGTSWPFQRANLGLVAAAGVFYFASYVLRALGWQKLFPAGARPARATCLAACGAAAASGVVLPFRLDYLVKIGTLRRMRGVKLGLEAIALSIVSLGLVDAVAFLPVSISATATTTSAFRIPLLLVVLFGLGACTVLVAGRRLVRVPFIASVRAWRAWRAAPPSRPPASPARLCSHGCSWSAAGRRAPWAAPCSSPRSASASRRTSRSSCSASRRRPRCSRSPPGARSRT
jgi:hypothetical protein